MLNCWVKSLWGSWISLKFIAWLKRFSNCNWRSRDGAVVRALASHQCGPGSIPGPGVICGLSLLLVIIPALRVFLRVLRFSSLHKNQHFQIPIRSGIRGPQVCQSRDCYVLPSLNIVEWFIYLFIYWKFFNFIAYPSLVCSHHFAWPCNLTSHE